MRIRPTSLRASSSTAHTSELTVRGRPVSATTAQPHRSSAESEAAKSWHVAVKSMALGHGLFKESPHGGTASAWSMSQGIAAALDLARHTGNYAQVDQMFAALGRYRLGNGYAPGVNPGQGTARFYDDNAWLGLDFMQAYAQTGKKAYLHDAERVFRFVQTGQTKDGAMRWAEHATPTFNTCSNGPAEELALRLYQTTKRAAYLGFAKRVDGYMDRHLREKNGLYIDHRNADGSPDTTTYGYNQGTPIGDKVLLYEITHEPKYLTEAQQTGKAALAHFKGDGFWGHAPVFNAIFFRNLMKLNVVAPDASYSRALKAYTNRAWAHGRDSRGLFTAGSIGSYGKDGVFIDQSGMVQMLALQDMSARSLDQVG